MKMLIMQQIIYDFNQTHSQLSVLHDGTRVLGLGLLICPVQSLVVTPVVSHEATKLNSTAMDSMVSSVQRWP